MTDNARAFDADQFRAEFLTEASGTGRAGTADAPDGPYMSMGDAADCYARLASQRVSSQINEAKAFPGPYYPTECPYGEAGKAGSPDAYLIYPGSGSASNRVSLVWPQWEVLSDIYRRCGSITPLYSRSVPLNPVDSKSAALSRPTQAVLAEVLAERVRQVGKGYDAAHDDRHSDGEIRRQAALAFSAATRWVRTTDTRARLIAAIALADAEIERLDRAHLQEQPRAE